MSDFYKIKKSFLKADKVEIYPDFQIRQSKDMMIRGGKFYAVWDPETGLWSQSEYRLREIVDNDILQAAEEFRDRPEVSVYAKYMLSDSSGMWTKYRKYANNLPDNYHQLDERITFSDTEVSKKDYVSKRLPYPLAEGSHDAWDEIVGTLYLTEEREKIEWAIGAVVSGDSRSIQKFLVFYGDPGTGKGTILDIIKELFDSYAVSFDSGELTGLGNSFPMEQFRSNPLVAIQYDGDLSRIADNTKLNSLVSHEPMMMKEKFKQSYDFVPHCFLFLASNHPVKITDAKSGIIRRLIDVKPSLQKIPIKRYFQLKNQIHFELGAIAKHCLDVYQEMGKHYYDGYKPIEMMFKTDPFFNFIDFHYLIFSKEDGISLKNAYDMYKDYCDNSSIQRLPMYKFREEMKNYFKDFEQSAVIDGQRVRSWYSGFDREKFEQKGEKHERNEGTRRENLYSGNEPETEAAPGTAAEQLYKDCPEWLRLRNQESGLDKALSAQPAQYATPDEKPAKKWSEVSSRLSDLDTSKIHYVRPPLQHIVIDFDKKNEKGEKDLSLNLKAASSWKPTYAEVSKGGKGLHLHYIWDGDISELGNVYEPDVEIKSFRGNSSLRRKLGLCNALAIAHLCSGLPKKEAKKTIAFDSVRSEKGLRDLIERNLNKEIHPGTKPSIDFIEKILDDAYESGLHYDVSDMRPDIMDFAIHSSHQAEYCLTRVAKMKFQSADATPWSDKDETDPEGALRYSDERLVFYDVEVFPNLVLVNWKFAGDTQCQRIINPKPHDIEVLLRYKLVGFNCRRYDNHILYALYIGKSIPEVYDISQGIINNSKNCTFREAYNISYTDVYDFCSKKQSLKKWEIELGIHHQELGLPWDQPVPEEKWLLVAEYCDNDVFATEALFNARQADWTARQILADIAGMSVNDTTNSLTTRIIFGSDKAPQSQFEYRFMGASDDFGPIPDLDVDYDYTVFDSKGKPVFPGYTFDHGVSTYRGEEVGEGGYVYAETGIHRNVALLDIASMHPSSIVAENLFGDEYTRRFRDILHARICIKHKDYGAARTLLGGKLGPYLDDGDPAQAKALAGALKIAINSVYGLTSAKFDNAFRDTRNVDNIVAKRGALFMVNLKHEVQNRGFTVAHIKTDSIKIPDATPEIIRFVQEYGKLYGYTFEHEATYDRMCLVNDAVYIARYSEDSFNEHPGEWTATGAQFQVPFVYKTLFSHEPVSFQDLCETKSCTTALYLDMNEGLPDVTKEEKEYAKISKRIRDLKKIVGPAEDFEKVSEEIKDLKKDLDILKEDIAKGHDYVFIGKVGLFTPVKDGTGGGLLMREKDGKYYAVGGSTGYRWLEAESVANDLEDIVDLSYFTNLCDEAVDTINQYGVFEDFVDISGCSNAGLPWDNKPTCGEQSYENCLDCPHWRIRLDSENFEEMFCCDKL